MAKAAHLMMVGARTKGDPTDDFYPTPPIAVEGLLSIETFRNWVWEPACGDGAISMILQARGHDVVSTDLHDCDFGTPGVDFLAQKETRGQNIITNPPYSLGTEFARHALRLPSVRKVAFLMRLQWLEGKERRLLFESTGLSRVHVFSGRLPRMHRHGWTGPKTSSTMPFAWFVWDVDHDGRTEIDWL